MVAYLSLAVGSVLMKKVGDISWQVYVAWMAFLVLVVMSFATSVFESGHVEIWREAKVPLLITAVYGALAVSIIAHGQYFDLIKKYEVSVIVPLTLYYVGAALIFPCVYIIARRAQKSVPKLNP